MHEKFLAIDIGASSGRHIIGWMEDGTLQTEEVYRFPNSVRRVDGHLEWDIDSLFANVKQGIKAAFEPPGYRRDAAGIALPAVHIDQQFQLPQELLHVDVDHNVLLSVQYTPDKGCGESAAWHFPRSLV